MLRPKNGFLFFALSLVVALGTSLAQEENRVLLISIDGLQPAYYLEAEERGIEMPNLQRLLETGSYAEGVEPTVPSNTFPNHTTMITGTWANRHGITDNDRFAPGEDNHRKLFHYYSDIQNSTLFDLVKQAGGKTAAVWWPVTSDAPVDFLFPDVPGDVPERGKFVFFHSSPGIQKILPGFEALDPPTDETRQAVTLAALEIGAKFVATHFVGLDSAQHDFGPFSPEAIAAAKKMDGFLGQILAKLEEAGGFRNWTIVVASDHGFLPLHTAVVPAALFRALGLLTLNDEGEIVDWEAYPWAGGGLMAFYLKDWQDDAAREKLDALIKFFAANDFYGVDRVYRGQDLEEINGLPGVYAVLAMKPGFAISDSLTNPGTLFGPTQTKGMHGYVPMGNPEILGSLVMSGNGIRRGQNLGIVKMVDIAPTIATLLGLRMTDVDGRLLEEAVSKE